MTEDRQNPDDTSSQNPPPSQPPPSGWTTSTSPSGAPSPGRRRTRAVGLAVAAFVLGLTGLVPAIGVPLGLIGLVLAVVALAKNTTAKGLAVTGLVLAIVGVCLQLLMFVVLMPGLSRARELARRAACMANLNGVGKTCAVYQGEYLDEYPWMVSSGRFHDTPTGTNRNRPLGRGIAHSITALPYLLVRSGQTPNMFVCPSDAEASADQKVQTSASWDFTEPANISYSWQAPLVGSDGMENGVTFSSDGGLAIMADKTPAYTGGVAATDWSGTLSRGEIESGMSANHSDGERVAVLYAALNVENFKRADVGVDDDNIYSAYGWPPAKTAQKQKGTTKIRDHRAPADSYLIGPIR